MNEIINKAQNLLSERIKNLELDYSESGVAAVGDVLIFCKESGIISEAVYADYMKRILIQTL